MSNSTQAEKLSKTLYSTHINKVPVFYNTLNHHMELQMSATQTCSNLIQIYRTHIATQTTCQLHLFFKNLGLAIKGFHFTTGCKELLYAI